MIVRAVDHGERMARERLLLLAIENPERQFGLRPHIGRVGSQFLLDDRNVSRVPIKARSQQTVSLKALAGRSKVMTDHGLNRQIGGHREITRNERVLTVSQLLKA